ncbi:MAG: alkaline phosphatase D family protein [Saprospiraceae bacterium]|nr:alkaline phosphatase family protein [Saprospiraceae bacterium]MDW8229021.1 alkaline phosphatase D family protein [Saprospiraceae bacterium]
MRTLFLFAIWAFSTCVSAQSSGPLISRIAFGSCGHQDRPQPILDTAVTHRPDVFVFLGDNIYGDTKDMQVLRDKYAKLGAKPEFQRLKKAARLLATWDDHDYGWNDSGRHYPFKKESKEIFLEFWEEPADSPRRQREGIYTSYMFEGQGRRLQLILLDTRTFRDNLRTYRGELHWDDRYFYPLDYYPHETTDSTLLGEVQWKWLEAELRKPADLRIIGSSTQFSIMFNGYEAWANFPHERKRMLQLIQKTRANGVLFISGDVHYGEISVLREDGLYPIYDVTASGITSTWYFATPNDNRIEGPVMENHFGLITVDWNKRDPVVKMEIYDIRNNQRVEYSVPLSAISFR